MKKVDVLIIGGSAASLMTAITAKKHYPKKNILILRKEEKVLIPCGIPYIFGTVGSASKNLIADDVLEKNEIELAIDEAVSIDRDKKIVITANGEEYNYDKLVLATGANPSIPSIEGLHLNGIYSVKKDIEYLETVNKRMDTAKNLIIIGGGFIGVEFADEAKKNRQIDITVIELEEHCLFLTCDKQACETIEEALFNAGIDIITSRRVQKFVGDETVKEVVLDNGQRLTADMVMIATGSKPNTELALSADLQLAADSGIATNEFMQTSDNDIFAVGDCAQKDSLFGSNFAVGRLASIATNEGRVAGANLFERRRKKNSSIGIFSTKVNGIALASAGLTEKIAKDKGLSVVTGSASSVDRHPRGMPRASITTVVLIFNRYNGIIIGGQITGGDSTGEMINVIGLAISHEMTAEDMATMQVGTHPALTASPIAYQLINAAEDGVAKLKYK